jgi:L-threonylcarbamoyladenylate synthase
MLERHYSPEAELVVFDELSVAREFARRAHEQGGRVGGLLTHAVGLPLDEVVPLPEDPRAYARLLYASLHTLDEAGCALILVERVPDGAGWAAIRDRLARAARGAGTRGEPRG